MSVPCPPFPARRLAVVAAVALWLAAAGTGFGLLEAYKAVPGDAAAAPPSWPAGSQVRPDPGRASLLLFCHPHCPCTRASLDELEAVLTRCGGRASARVLFVVPEEGPRDWEHTDLWRCAAGLPGVVVRADAGGREARRFSASTSGHALLYGPDGRLLYHGGLTGSRVHAGDNPRRAAVLALLRGAAAGPLEGPTFGCSLFDSSFPRPESEPACCPQPRP